MIGPYPVSDLATLDAERHLVAVRSVLAAARYLLLDGGARTAPVATVFDRVGDLLG